MVAWGSSTGDKSERMGFVLKTFMVLILASALEIGVDALIRIKLSGATYSMVAGAVTLFA
jgi:hypothetical protein